MGAEETVHWLRTLLALSEAQVQFLVLGMRASSQRARAQAPHLVLQGTSSCGALGTAGI